MQPWDNRHRKKGKIIIIMIKNTAPGPNFFPERFRLLVFFSLSGSGSKGSKKCGFLAPARALDYWLSLAKYFSPTNYFNAYFCSSGSGSWFLFWAAPASVCTRGRRASVHSKKNCVKATFSCNYWWIWLSSCLVGQVLRDSWRRLHLKHLSIN